jgi:hypothetical protein
MVRGSTDKCSRPQTPGGAGCSDQPSHRDPPLDPLARLATPLGLYPATPGLLYLGGRLLKDVLASTDDPLLTVAAVIALICAPCALAQRLLFRESWWRAATKAAGVFLLLATWPYDVRWPLVALASLGALSLRQRRTAT